MFSLFISIIDILKLSIVKHLSTIQCMGSENIIFYDNDPILLLHAAVSVNQRSDQPENVQLFWSDQHITSQ